MNAFGSYGGSPVRRDKSKTYGGELVNQATEEFLIGPDWGINMEVSDYVNGHGETAATDVAKQLRKRLKSKNPKVILLALTLLEGLVKNCSFTLHAAVGADKFQARMYAVCLDKNPEVAERALGLVQQFGKAFQSMSETLPGYLKTWNKLKSQHIIFPALEEESAVPVFTPPRSAAPASSEGGGKDAVNEKRKMQFAKLVSDVDEVLVQTKSAKALMQNHAGEKLSDDILDVLDFLDQCKPRLVRVIEAGQRAPDAAVPG